jgi:hypothetical protein
MVAALIADVLENRKGSFLELLTSARQPLNRELAEYYGIEANVGDPLTFVDIHPCFPRVDSPATRLAAKADFVHAAPRGLSDRRAASANGPAAECGRVPRARADHPRMN